MPSSRKLTVTMTDVTVDPETEAFSETWLDTASEDITVPETIFGNIVEIQEALAAGHEVELRFVTEFTPA